MSAPGKLLFRECMSKVLQAPMKSNLCLGVSGGPDSLALAFLVSDYLKNESFGSSPKPKLHAITINHRLRPSSRAEMRSTVKELEKLNIKCKTYDMSWRPNNKETGIELKARLRRFEIYKKFMIETNSKFLFLGHHLDDISESILLDIIHGKSKSQIDTMTPITGFPIKDAPLTTRDFRVVRPLLSYRKAELEEICRLNNLSYVTDESNADVTVGSRNAIRYMLKNEHLLPEALRHDYLINSRQKLHESREQTLNEAQKLFNFAKFDFNSSDGSCSLQFNRNTLLNAYKADNNVLSELLYHVLSIVTPMPQVKKSFANRFANQLILPKEKENISLALCNIVSKAIEDDEVSWVVHRNAVGVEPTPSEEQIIVRLKPGAEKEVLFDKRWSIKLKNIKETYVTVFIDFLARLKRKRAKVYLNNCIKELRTSKMTPSVRGNIPVLSILHEKYKPVKDLLPTLSIPASQEIIEYDIKYKCSEDDMLTLKYRKTL